MSANTRPVKLLWGLEADTDPDSDAYWRMGYTYPVQVTQWALASAPKHPVLTQFVDNLKAQIRKEKESPKAPVADPLTRTGPAAVTLATSMWLEKEITFRWNAVTGLKDGGKSKLASDVLVLPITGFRYVAKTHTASGSSRETDNGHPPQPGTRQVRKHGVEARRPPRCQAGPPRARLVAPL